MKRNNRRDFLQKIGLGTAGLAAAPFAVNANPSSQPSPEADDEQYLKIGDEIAVADTGFGKIRGYQMNGVYTFLGVPYGADTSGKNRFMPPQKPQKWEGIKDTVWWEIRPRRSWTIAMLLFIIHSQITGTMTTFLKTVSN